MHRSIIKLKLYIHVYKYIIHKKYINTVQTDKTSLSLNDENFKLD